VNRFINHSQVVTINNYNNIGDLHTTNHFTLSFLSLFFNRRFLVTNLSWLTLNSTTWVWIWHILRPTVTRPVCLGINPLLGLMTRFFNTVRDLRVCWYGAPSLTRGRVCLLQLLLSSPAQLFLGPSPAGLMTTLYCLRFDTPPTWRTRSLYFYPPGTEWPGYSQSQSHIATDSQSVSLSWCRTPSGAYDQEFVYWV
jgi:hypothetical protein